MDDKETLHRRARLRELIRECFNDRTVELLSYIESRTGKRPNQGELSALQKDHGGKSFGDKKAKNLAEQIGLARRWFDLPAGSLLSPEEWGKEIDLPLEPPALEGVDRRKAKRRWGDIVDANIESAPTMGMLPLISDVQAGSWNEIVDNFQPGDAEDWIPCPFKHGPNAFILRVAGLSMYNPGGDKSYAPGDFIAVDPQVEPLNRRMVVAKIDHEERATFKQLIIEPDGTCLLQALNPSWPNRIMPMPEGSRIVGVVIGKWTPE